MKENQKIFYLRIILIFLVLALVGGLFLDISFGNPQKSKWHYIFQKYCLKNELYWPMNYNGIWNEWNKSGELMVSTQVKGGVMDGEQLEWSIYESTPKYLFKKLLYKNGELQQIREYFYDKGETYSLSNWEKGKLNGLYVRYYRNNKIRYKHEYINDILDGGFIGFYKGGKKSMEGKFKNNLPIGVWNFWDMDGKTTSKLNCDNNEEIKEIIHRYRVFTADD